MNICLVSTGFMPEDGGGIGTYISNLARGLKKQSHNVFVLTKTSKEDKEEVVEGIRVYRYKIRYFSFIEKYIPGLCWSMFISRKISKLNKEVGLDLIEFPNWEGVGFAYLLKRKRKPVVMRVHTPYFETLSIDSTSEKISMGDRFICWMEKRTCQKSDQLVSSTECHRNFISIHYRLDRKKIKIVPLGIDLIKNSRNGKKKGSETLKVIFVSRLEKRKGATTFIQAIPKVLNRFENVQFTLIGKDRNHAPGGRFHKEYFDDEFGALSDKVQFTGFVTNEELEQYYMQADLFVVPSVYESFGLIYVEAMMHGKPVIGCRAGGIPEVIEEGRTGMLTDPEDSDQLADLMCQLLSDQNLREKMGKEARKLCEEKFSLEIMSKNTEDLYYKTIGNSNG